MYIVISKGVVDLNQIRQERMPLFEALKKYKDEQTVSFHVPAHKHGVGLPDFTEYVGTNVMNMDLTILADLDSICHPTGVIQEAETLAAEAFGAARAFFLVNGTTSGIQAMIMTMCEPGDKIIVPRNAHKSVIGGVILSGAIPVYVQPEIDHRMGIAKGVTPESIELALKENPDTKAVFIIHSTYYGMASDLETIVNIASSYGVPVIADEAHGAHFAFHPALPKSAMSCGVAMSALSVHKLGGSMTQSSILLVDDKQVDPAKVKTILNLTQTTSPSYVLMASLDAARQQLALKGEKLFDQVIALADKARYELNQIPGVYVYGAELNSTPGCFQYDPTKIAITLRQLGISAYEAEVILRKDHQIAFEMADLHNLLAIIGIGDTEETIGKLVTAVRVLAEDLSHKHITKQYLPIPEMPELAVSPREAFYSETRSVPLEEAIGEVSAEIIMAYPPGIPIICPGERITADLVEYIHLLKGENCRLQGTEDPNADHIRVLSRNMYLYQNGSQLAVGLL
jgi:arginine decarboxylase